MYCTNCRKNDHRDADCWSTRGDNGWAEFKTAPPLLEQLKALAGRKMTIEEAFEQRVSFVFSTQDSMTKDQVREALTPRA